MAMQRATALCLLCGVFSFTMPCTGIFIRSISPKHGSLAGGTTITIEGNDLMGNETAGVDVYTGPLPCDILWYASNNNKVYCRTHPLYSGTRETKLVYSNWLVATRTSCKDCFYEFNDKNTPRVHRSQPVLSSRAKLGFGGELKGKFARQYEIDVGNGLGRCDGLMRKDAPQLGFGLDYEQEIAKSWTEDLDVTCYLPELEAGRYNYSIMVNHLAPGVIVSDDDEAGTKMFKGPNQGLGYARFPESAVTARGSDAKLFLVVPQTGFLSTQISGKLGGHLLTIQGSGFDTAADCADNVVRLSGIPCRVLRCTSTELQCVIGAAEPHEYVPPQPFASTHGLTATTHDGFSTGSRKVSGAAMTKITWHDPISGDFNTPLKRFGVSGMKLQGYFVAPYSAYYSFYALGDASTYCSIRVGTDHNASSAQQLSYCGEGLHADHKQVYLDAGHRYYFEHQHRQMDGGLDSAFRAAVRIHAPAINNQWIKSSQEHQYHSWEEIQTLKFTPSFAPEEMEFSISNVWGGTFKLYNTLYKRTSGPIALGLGPTVATTQLQTQLRANNAMIHQHCGRYVNVKHLAGDPKVNGFIKFRLRYGCTPRKYGAEAHSYWSKRVRIITSGLISNKTSTTTTITTTTKTTTTESNVTNSTNATNATNATTFAFITASTNTDLDTSTSGNDWHAGPDFKTRITLTQRGSKKLGGTFRLSLNGFDYTSDIAMNAPGSTVAARMRMQLSLVRELNVERTAIGQQIMYTFRFRGQRNMPLLKVWQTDLTPRFGILSSGQRAKVTVDVNSITDGGGDDLYYDPIPAEFFEVQTAKPNAVVTVNGFAAECATNRNIAVDNYDKTFDPFYAVDKSIEMDCDGDATKDNCMFDYSAPDCSFVYDPTYTPIITKVSTERDDNEVVAGDVITIEGTGFRGTNTVQVGGSACIVQTESTTLITCIISHMKAGSYHPVVVSSAVGQAEVAPMAEKVHYQLVIGHFSPIEGSVRGGGMLVINGTGFSNIAHENNIIVGGGACYAKSSGFDHVLCYIPFSHLDKDLDTRCWGGMVCADRETDSGFDDFGPELNGNSSYAETVQREVRITQIGTGYSWEMSSKTEGVVGTPRVTSGFFRGFQRLTVYENDIVTFVGDPGPDHNFAMKDSSVLDSSKNVIGPTAKDAAFDLKWSPAGLGGKTFIYYCVPHASFMFGEIIVKSGSAPGRRVRSSDNSLSNRVTL